MTQFISQSNRGWSAFNVYLCHVTSRHVTSRHFTSCYLTCVVICFDIACRFVLADRRTDGSLTYDRQRSAGTRQCDDHSSASAGGVRQRRASTRRDDASPTAAWRPDGELHVSERSARARSALVGGLCLQVCGYVVCRCVCVCVRQRNMSLCGAHVSWPEKTEYHRWRVE